jgi:hypothetical protein
MAKIIKNKICACDAVRLGNNTKVSEKAAAPILRVII